MKIKVLVWQEEDVWCASVPSLKGCHTCADNFEDLQDNLKDAVEGWLDAMSSMESEKEVMEMVL